MLALLGRLLRAQPEPIRAGDVGQWWRGFCERRPILPDPIDRAIMAGFLADRVGFAFAGGYQAALRALARPLPDAAVASFCVTEAGGNHPRAIQSRLVPRTGGGFTLSGAKRWSTMGPLATILLVVASEGTDESGRNRLRLVSVEAGASGVRVASMPPTPFAPEVPHAAIEFEGVELSAGAVWPGDGYADYVKPFRTVEDVHVHGALLGYLLSVARRHDVATEVSERIVASLIATRTLGLLDPGAAEVHAALAGVLAQDARLLGDLTEVWTRVGEAERARWQRDQALFGSVAGQVRELRRRRAWETLAGGQRP